MSNRLYKTLNIDQKEIFDKISKVSNVIDYSSSGPSGSEKTFEYKLYNLLKSKSKNVVWLLLESLQRYYLKFHKVHKGFHVTLLSDSLSNIAVQSNEEQFLR